MAVSKAGISTASNENNDDVGDGAFPCPDEQAIMMHDKPITQQGLHIDVVFSAGIVMLF
jgi:hypothetical protein